MRLALEDIGAKLPPPVKEALYHVAVAALNNALAHAQPKMMKRSPRCTRFSNSEKCVLAS